MTLTVYYTFTVSRPFYSTDPDPYDVELTSEEENIINALLPDTDLNSVPELSNILERAAEEIVQEELTNQDEFEDEDDFLSYYDISVSFEQ